MAKELSRIKYETEREEKMRQHIRENRYSITSQSCYIHGNYTKLGFSVFISPITIPSLELRELEAKLKSAYVNKERAAQIAEQEAMKFERMVGTFFCFQPETFFM